MMKNKYTVSEAYDLAMQWMPKIKKGMASNGEIDNLAFKIQTGEVTVTDMEKIHKKLYN